MQLITTSFIFLACCFANVVALSLKDAVVAEQAWIQNVRRHLHQYPELLYEEEKTSEIIRSYLDELDISYKYVQLLSNSCLSGRSNAALCVRQLFSLHFTCMLP